jgi:hypothetical protein
MTLPPVGTARLAPPVEPVFYATTRIDTFDGTRGLTNATGFFFRRAGRLFLVTCRHVMVDDRSGHHPDRVEITLHAPSVDLTRTTTHSLLLYEEGRARWRQAKDSGGPIDVAALEVDEAALGRHSRLEAFIEAHLQHDLQTVGIGEPVTILGFPLGFHDTLHRLPVARQGAIASAFGVRFQGEGYFLTDARTHRGASGAPVLMRQRAASPQDPLPWKLLGVHASRVDMRNRDRVEDDALSLNCAWYADILLTLTDG